jgi:hypothetical protein
MRYCFEGRWALRCPTPACWLVGKPGSNPGPPSCEDGFGKLPSPSSASGDRTHGLVLMRDLHNLLCFSATIYLRTTGMAASPSSPSSSARSSRLIQPCPAPPQEFGVQTASMRLL